MIAEMWGVYSLLWDTVYKIMLLVFQKIGKDTEHLEYNEKWLLFILLLIDCFAFSS